MGDTLNNKTRYLRIKSGKDWTVDENEKISFLNFSSITTYFENSDLDRIEYYCDGSLSSVVVGVLSRTKINRFSFDFTSMADPVLNHAEEKGIPVNIIGAKEDEVADFAVKIKKHYPKLNLGVVRDGYFGNDETGDVVASLVDVGGVAILGLGAGKQEKVLMQLIDKGFKGSCYTCGGFVRQESHSQGDYYPKIFDKLNIRFLYRMYKEPHTITRYLIDYPKNILLLAYLVISGKLKIKID